MSEAAPPAPPPSPHRHRRAVLWGARALGYVVYAYVVLTEIILALGFVLLLFGANPDPPFVQWAYRSLDRAMEPFRGIFTPIELGQTGNEVEAVLDTSVLFAMLIYGITAWLVQSGIGWLSGRLDRLEWQEAQDRARMGATDPGPPASPPTGVAKTALHPRQASEGGGNCRPCRRGPSPRPCFLITAPWPSVGRLTSWPLTTSAGRCTCA